MRKNYIALGLFLSLLFFVLSMTPHAEAALIRPGISGNSWLVTATQSTEITVPQAELQSEADLYDYQKGLHITLSRDEGTLVNFQSIIRNDNDAAYRIEAGSIFRYKIGSGSWVEFDRWNTSGVLNAHDTNTGNTEPIDATRMGFWENGNQIHVAIGVIASPVADPSDQVVKAWSLWVVIGESSSDGGVGSTPGDGTSNGGTNNGGEQHSEHSYTEMLSIFEPVATPFGSTLGFFVFLCVCVLVVIAVLSIVMTDKEDW